MSSPIDIEPEFWVRSDGIYTDAGSTAAGNGDLVQQWTDRSSNANHWTQATSGLRGTAATNVLDGYAAVTLTGGKYYDSGSIFDSTWNTAMAVYAVVVDAGGSSGQYMWFNTKPDASLFALQRHTGASGWPDNIITSNASGAATNNGIRTVQTSDTPMCLGFRYNGAEQTAFYDGHAVVKLGTGNLAVSGIGRFGAYTGGSGFDWSGNYVELVGFKNGLNATREAALWDYFCTRYPTLGLGDQQKVVTCDGDSLTFGTGATLGATYQYHLRAELGTGYRMVSLGVPGQTAADMETDAATQVDPYYRGVPGDVLVCWGGTNDAAGGATASTIQTRIQTYCENRRAAGWRVVVCTIIARSNAGLDANFETTRQSVNTWLRNNYTTFADRLCDLGGDSRIGDNGDSNDTTYFDADKVHLNGTGYGVVAELLAPQILSLASTAATLPLVNGGLVGGGLINGGLVA